MGYYKDNKPDILDSWKEISSYLDRSEKTCRNWAQSLDLPVHRIGNSPKARVYAYKNELDNWLSDSDVSKIEENRQNNLLNKAKKRVIISILTLSFLFVLFLIINQILKRNHSPPEKIGIAVVHFDNRNNNKDLDYLKIVIPDLLMTSLEVSENFSVMTWERMRDLAKQIKKEEVEYINKDMGFEICRREGIKNIAVGSYVKLGDTFVTDVKIIDVETKELIKSVSSKGKGEQSILDTQIDEIAGEVTKITGLAGIDSKEKMISVREVTTNYMEAYKNYIKGRKAIGKNWSEAKSCLEKAVEIDPTFSMAYHQLAFVYFSLGNRKGVEESITRAKKFSENLSKREKLWIDWGYLLFQRDSQEKRYQINKILAEKYPKDKMAHFWHGASYRVRGLFDEGIKVTKIGLELDPEHLMTLNGLFYLYFNKGDYEKAMALTDRISELNPNSPRQSQLGLVYFSKGDLEEAKKRYKRSSVTEVGVKGLRIIAYIEALRENYNSALLNITEYISSTKKKWKGYGYVVNGFYNLWLGKLNESEKDLLKAENIMKNYNDDFFNGIVELQNGWLYFNSNKFPESLSSFNNWKNRFIKLHYIDASHYDDIDINTIHSLLELFVYLKENKTDKVKYGLKGLKEKISNIQLAFVRDVVSNWYSAIKAEVFLKENNSERAIEECKKIKPPWIPIIGQVFYPMIYNMPYIRDTLARAYVQNGEVEKAIAEYEKLSSFDPESKDRRLIHPIYHYRLAKLYQQRGLDQKAIKSFNKFINIWKDCDPQFKPMVEDAKKRVRVLQREMISEDGLL